LSKETITSHPLRPHQQAAHELSVGNDGLLYQEGQRYSTGDWEESRYVMGVDGKIYADRKDRMNGVHPDNHSSFLAGAQPAAAAGELVAHRGVIESVDNLSGHYAPSAAHMQQLIDELERRGVDTSGIRQTDISRR
jgi:hypothetical protein